MKKQTNKSKQKSITIPKKALYGIVPAIAIIVVLFSKGKAPEVLLFGIGIFLGIFMGKWFFKK